MKKLILMLICCVFILSVKAQYKFPSLDKSIADIAYYPLNTANSGAAPKIKVVYSRPLKNGREIFGSLEKFGKVWRTGANESTEIRFFTPVKLGDKTVPAGTYGLFTIPEKDSWTIIINSATNRWGAFSYDQTKDVARVTVPVKPLDNVVEAFSITFTEGANGGANLVMGWDKTAVEVPVTFQ